MFEPNLNYTKYFAPCIDEDSIEKSFSGVLSEIGLEKQ